MKLKRNKDRRNSLTKAHHFVSRDQGDWDTMDGYMFNGDYIGYSTLSKPVTGVGILQQPIKEQYLKSRKQGNTKKVTLRLVKEGLAISLVDTGGGQRGEMFYDTQSISFIECLKFTILSGNEKKIRAMFVPLEEKNMPSVKDKNAFTVDKSHHFLTQINHPPLLACVLRRPKGIKALDCHIFMLETVEDAFKIVSIIRNVQQHGSNPDLEFKQNDNNSFRRGQNNDVIRTEYGEYSVYRGQKQYELRDDYFRAGQEMGREGDYSPRDHDDTGYGWSYERKRDSMQDDNWRNYNSDQYERQEERYPVQMRGGSQNRGDYPPYDQGSREYISHGRQRSSDSGERMNMSFSDSSEKGGRYDDMGERRSYSERDRDRGNISPRATHQPPKVAEKPNKPDPMLRPMGPPSPGHHSPPQPLSPRSPSYQHSGPQYGQPPPRSNYNPPSPTGPGYSMSNLESRQTDPRQEEEYQAKPVAKVPPHMVAGVKVLPTGFMPSAIKLKPKTKQHDKSYGSEDSDPDYDNNIAKYRKPPTDYGYPSEKRTEERNTINYNRGSGDLYQGGDNYSKGNSYEHDKNNRGFSYAPDYGRQQSDDNRQYIENYDDQYGVQRRGSDQRPDKMAPNRYSVPSSVYDDRSRDPGNRWSGSSGGGGQRSHSNYDMSGRPSGDPPKGKEAEIASMFTNFHIQKGGQPPYQTSDNDFEQTLGYLP